MPPCPPSLGLGLGLQYYRAGGGPSPVISGNPYPGETLTSDIEGQWTVNDENVGGPAETSYTQLIADIGKVVTQVGAANSITTLGDVDAFTWIIGRETFDAQLLESPVRIAINDLFVGLKATESKITGVSNWTAMETLVFLAGLRSFSGLGAAAKGTNPTFTNFVSGDYLRKTGLKGNGSNKNIDSNVPGNDIGSTSWGGMGVYSSEPDSSADSKAIFGSGTANDRLLLRMQSDRRIYSRIWHPDAEVDFDNPNSAGLYHAGKNGTVGSNLIYLSGDTHIYSGTTGQRTNISIWVFSARVFGDRSNARNAFYYTGNGVDPAVVESLFESYLESLSSALP